MQAKYILVITTCAAQEEAARLAAVLVERRVAACVQISSVNSVYRWQGAIEQAEEVRLVIKAKASDYAAIESLIKSLHSYQNPEILAIPVIEGSAAYLEWLDFETLQ